jgi:hypothetical protein
MATTLTTIVDDVLVIDAIQGALKNALVALDAFSLGISVEGKAQNDVIRVPVITGAATYAKTPGTASTPYGTVTGTSITLSGYREASWQLNEGEVSAKNASVMFAALAAQRTHDLAQYIIDLVISDVTAAHFGTDEEDVLTVAEGDFGQADLGLLWKKCETKKMGRDRSVILNAAYTGALIGDSNLGLILATLGKDALATAKLPPLMGFNMYNYSGLTSPTGENLTGFACDKAAIGVALAPPEALVAAGEGNKISDTIITDPESKIVCRYIRMADADGGYHKGRVEVLIGHDKIQDSVVRIRSGA